MPTKTLRYTIMLVITALIWGLTFSFQRKGMEHMTPFFYNFYRFFLGACTLIPIIALKKQFTPPENNIIHNKKHFIIVGLIAGACVYLGAAFQQLGLVYTQAGKAGFITGLYIIIVPIMGLVFKYKTGILTWIGAVLGVIGMYLLSISNDFSISPGDLLVLISAFFWALHVHLVGRYAPRYCALKFSFIQYLGCALLSLTTALILEDINLTGVYNGFFYIFFAGFFSVGIAYTLQVIAQKKVPPANAAIIMSLESIFALLGGMVIIHEMLTIKEFIGCFIMFTGILLSQFQIKRIKQFFSKKILINRK